MLIVIYIGLENLEKYKHVICLIKIYGIKHQLYQKVLIADPLFILSECTGPISDVSCYVQTPKKPFRPMAIINIKDYPR